MKKSRGLDGWPGWPEGCWWGGRPRQRGTDPGPREAAPSARPRAAVDTVVRSLSWGSGGLGDCTWQLARPPCQEKPLGCAAAHVLPQHSLFRFVSTCWVQPRLLAAQHSGTGVSALRAGRGRLP